MSIGFCRSDASRESNLAVRVADGVAPAERHRRIPRVLSTFVLIGIAGAALLPASAKVATGATGSAAELVGLWKAKQRFGPDTHGPIVIRKTSDGWIADFLGREFPMRDQASVLSFELPNELGSFRAKVLGDDSIANGQWFQPGSPANPPFGTGVRFASAGPGRWRGEVLPIDDSFTLYLMAQKRPDGSIGAFLRNPERNIGVTYNVERLERRNERVELFGRRSGAKSDSVLMRGSFHAESGMLTLALPQMERGGTFDFMREGVDSEFYPRGKRPARYVYHPPLVRDDGWPVALLEDVNIDQRGIEAFVQRILDMPMDSVQAPEVHAIAIARHGKLVLEEYFHGYHRDLPHDSRSAGKSLTATLIGAAIQGGAPLRLSDPVYEVMHGGVLPAGLEPRKHNMKLEHLLTMSSGFFCDDGNPEAPGNENTMLDQEDEPDFYRYTLKIPMDRVPGAKAVYCSADPNLALGVLNRATGEHLMDLFDRLLGEPLGITQHGWYLSPSLQPYGGGSVRLLPRDFMKMGQLMLDGGVWNGRRILHPEFVKRASAPLYDLNNIRYGFLWWGIDWPYKDRTVHAYFAGGNGGQGVIVIPELDMVVLTHGGSYSTRVGLEIQQGFTPRYILPAVRESGDDKDAPVVPRDYKVIYGRPNP